MPPKKRARSPPAPPALAQPPTDAKGESNEPAVHPTESQQPVAAAVSGKLSLASTVALRGSAMPLVGLGTYHMKGAKCTAAVAAALRCGVRCIDTAQSYNNGAAIAAGIAQSGVPRSDVYIITKVKPGSMTPAGVRSAVKEQAAFFGGVLDLVLLHWPGTETPNVNSKLHPAARVACWLELSRLKGTPAVNGSEATVRSVGVSNYTAAHLEHLLAAPGVTEVPAVNQVECHPFLPQAALREYCAARQIEVQPYTSLGRSTEAPRVLYGRVRPYGRRLVEDADVLAVAARHARSAEAVLLRWALQHRMSVIPKAALEEHVLANAVEPLAFALAAEDVAVLDGLAGKRGEVVYAYRPDKFPN